MAHYGKIEYWEERYTRQTEPFDWYQVYSGVKDVITQFINKSDKILNVGAGNSSNFIFCNFLGLSEDMYEDGYENTTNIDISHTVVSYMKEKFQGRCPNMGCKFLFNTLDKKMDVLDMSEFQIGEFNVVLDKGTLDSVLCGDNSVPNAEKMMQEIYRILAPNGVYICVTYGDEEHRKKYFKNQDWEIKVDKVAKPSTMISANINVDEKDPKNFHYIYTMTKTIGLPSTKTK